MLGPRPDHRALMMRVGQRLAAFGGVSQSGLAVVETLAGASVEHPRGANLGLSADAAPHFIMSGWACHTRPQARRRQIFGFLLPGDVLGSFWRRSDAAFCHTVALTRVMTLSAAPLLAQDADGAYGLPDVVEAARRAEDHARHLVFDHLVRLGFRDAYDGLAHLLLELHGRLQAVGLTEGGDFLLPIGQRALAQAMGLSLAHTNQTLQRLTADGLLEKCGDCMRLLRPDRMAELADFSFATSGAFPVGPAASKAHAEAAIG